MGRLGSALVDLLLAPACLGCRSLIRSSDEARLVCRRCRAALRALPSPSCPRCGAPRLATGRSVRQECAECESWPRTLIAARSACLLRPPADVLVHQLKYRGWRALAEPMAERMARLMLPVDAPAARTCVPVPTSRTRRRQRGYNQAELLALAFAARTGRDVRPVLERTGSTSSQTTLQPVARGANVAGAFNVAGSESRSCRDAHLLLIDDVLTTGATATECARALSAAGARCITVVTFARALDARLTRT